MTADNKPPLAVWSLCSTRQVYAKCGEHLLALLSIPALLALCAPVSLAAPLCQLTLQ